jgi:hypothetical protein
MIMIIISLFDILVQPNESCIHHTPGLQYPMWDAARNVSFDEYLI